MSLLPARVPTTALYDFTRLFVPTSVSTEATIELVIRIKDKNLKARELGAYLSLADRIYGRLTKEGLKSYALTPNKQLQITQVRQGSLEFIIAQIIEHPQVVMPLAILFLFLKYLPGALKGLSEAAKNTADTWKSIADGWKSIEDAKLARLNRKRLKATMQQDDILKQLDANRLNQLVALLDALQAMESRNLPAPTRFAENQVQSIDLTVRDKNNPE